MKRIVKNSLFTTILMVWGMMYSSCEGWTDPESINIHYPTFEEQNPQLYADYIRDLKRYKDGEHKLVFVSFDNPEKKDGAAAHRQVGEVHGRHHRQVWREYSYPLPPADNH